MPKLVANVQKNCWSQATRRTPHPAFSTARNFFSKGLTSSGQEASELDRLNRVTPYFLACVFVSGLGSPASAAPSSACTPARAGKHVAEQPEAWRKAVQSLIESTAAPDQPWGCVGGEVDLVVTGLSGTLTVVDAQGRVVSREVTSPDDVAPLGEALLAKPLLDTEPVAPAEPKPGQTNSGPEPEAATARDPRLFIAATAGPRYGGPNHTLWGSFGVAVNVPLRPWGGGVWLRFDGFSRALDAPVPPTRVINVGGAAYWSTTIGRIEMQSLLKPSLVGITRRITFNGGPEMPGPQPPQPEKHEVDVTNLDFRLGAEARFAIVFTKRWRGVLGLDAEVSPDQLATATEQRRPGEPGEPGGRLPAYTVGVGLGVEVAVP